MPDAAWLARHVRLLRASHHHWTGLDLIPATLDDQQAVAALDDAGFAVVSHGTQPDPIFNYGNRMALKLFEMSWDDLTTLPSRLSAEPLVQSERDRLMQHVTRQGYINDYSGVRISKTGQRFMIKNATVWNLLDEDGRYYGQAALIRDWQYLPIS